MSGGSPPGDGATERVSAIMRVGGNGIDLVGRVVEVGKIIVAIGRGAQVSAGTQILVRVVGEDPRRPQGSQARGPIGKPKPCLTRQPLRAVEEEKRTGQTSVAWNIQYSAHSPIDLVQVIVAADGSLVITRGLGRGQRVDIREIAVGGQTMDARIEVKPAQIPRAPYVSVVGAKRTTARLELGAVVLGHRGRDGNDAADSRGAEADGAHAAVDLDALHVANGNGAEIHAAAGGGVEGNAVHVDQHLIGRRAAQGYRRGRAHAAEARDHHTRLLGQKLRHRLGRAWRSILGDHRTEAATSSRGASVATGVATPRFRRRGASAACAESARGYRAAAPQPSSANSRRKECDGRRRACHALVMGRCLCTKKPLACAGKGVGSHQQTFSAEGHREFGNREWISWLRSNATKSRGRWLSPSRGVHPSGDTRTFFSFTVAGPRRIHTGFPISRCYSVFRTNAP
jgi:hypothetical protein